MFDENSSVVPLFSGAIAGLSVDLVLFPIDTIKTRMQSPKGFLRSGGLRGIYSGAFAVSLGSAPNAAVFFLTYDRLNRALQKQKTLNRAPVLTHIVAASCAEVTACLIRVPTEVIKQRAQTSQKNSAKVFGETLLAEGVRGLFRGYCVTISREIPFAAIQYPLWEFLKATWERRFPKTQMDVWRPAVCGFVAGGVAAALTTPLDVAKTWIMLAKSNNPLASGNIVSALKHIFHERGLSGLLAGLTPRVTMISCGGFIFLGVYDFTREFMLMFMPQ